MDPLSITASMAGLFHLSRLIVEYQFDVYISRPVSYVRLYGISGVAVAAFGSRNVWDMEAEVLGGRKDDTAMAFRKSVQDESTTCAVAGAIVSQIAITALQLPFLSQAHWVAQGFWIFSLISGIMTVYYASSEHRTMGRLLLPGQVRGWIRGERDREPDVISQSQSESELLKLFLPGPSSVLTISAPQLLLSASLYSFLVGLGVYVSFVWRRQLDPNAGFNDSRNTFITYIVSIAICEVTYSISSVNQEDPTQKNPWLTVIANVENYWESRPFQTNKQQNASGSEQSEQFSHTEPSNSAQPDNIQGSAGQGGASLIVPITSILRTSTDGVAPKAVQNQLSASAVTEVLQSPTPAPGSDIQETRTTTLSQGHADIPRLSPQHQVLIKALQDSARLRRESSKLEELIARCYEQLLASHQAVETANQD